MAVKTTSGILAKRNLSCRLDGKTIKQLTAYFEGEECNGHKAQADKQTNTLTRLSSKWRPIDFRNTWKVMSQLVDQKETQL
jgi:hypothetical protein